MSGYTIYGHQISLYTRKLEAAFECYGLPFSMRSTPGVPIRIPRSGEPLSELEQRAGTHRIPVLVTPENWCLSDTTPIMMAMDARVPARRLFPRRGQSASLCTSSKS